MAGNRIVVIGGSGFIGSNVVEEFTRESFKVIVVDRKKPTVNCKWIKCDITKSDLSKHLRKGDFVFDFAAMANARQVNKHPLKSTYENYISLARVIDACVTKKVSRLIFASSYWVSEGTINGQEDSNFKYQGTQNVYGNEKISNELLIHSWAILNPFNYSILRLGNPFGPRMWDGLVIKDFIKKIKSNKSININGNGKQKRQFIYVKDIAQVCVNITKKHNHIGNQVYNITGDNAISIINIAKLLGKSLKKEVIFDFVNARNHDFKLKFCPNTKAKAELKLKLTPIKHAIESTVSWYDKDE